MMRTLLLGIVFFLSSVALATDGFVTLNTGRSVYVTTQMKSENAPTLVLLNGLTYNTKHWDAFVKALNKYDINCVRFDFVGQGRTLTRFGVPDRPIDSNEQVADVEALLESLNLRDVTVLGLSYGGGIAIAHAVAFPDRVKQVIAMAPYTEPLPVQDLWIKQQIAATRLMFPFNPASDDELYDFFLQQNIYTTYPMAEPSVLEQRGKLEATFRLVQGIRHIKMSKVVKQLTVPIHLVTAQFDQYLDSNSLKSFWRAVPKDLRTSRAEMLNSEHKIPEAQPRAAAAWVNAIIQESGLIDSNRSFKIDPTAMTARSSSGTIELK